MNNDIAPPGPPDHDLPDNMRDPWAYGERIPDSWRQPGPTLRDTPQRRIAREAQRANEVKERVRMLVSKGHECTEIADDKLSFTWCHQAGGCDAPSD